MAQRIPPPQPELSLSEVVLFLAKLQEGPDKPKTVVDLVERVRAQFGNEEVNTLLRKTVVQLVSEVKLGDLVHFISLCEQLRGTNDPRPGRIRNG